MIRSQRLSLLFAIFALLAINAGGVFALEPKSASSRVVDFRYAMPWWQTAICLPDDPDKALVGKEGQILFDFGRSDGYRDFALCLQPDLAGGTKWVKQHTLSARTPILRTEKDASGVNVLEETFVVIPSENKPAIKPQFERLDGNSQISDWAKPARTCPAAFRDIQVSSGVSPLKFRLPVPAGSRVTLIFGLCEGWHKEAGKRPLVLGAEGADSQTVDPVKDFGANVPGFYRLTAVDADKDGLINVSVGTPEGSSDRNAILNALWAFQNDAPDDETLFAKPVNAYAFFSSAIPMPERRVIVLTTMQNTTAAEVVCRPTMHIASTTPVTYSAKDGVVSIDGGTTLSSAGGIASCDIKSNADATVTLPPVKLAPHASAQVAFTIDRHASAAKPPVSIDQACALRDHARDWWEKLDLPYNTIQIPDAGIQEMIESSVRNIWQAREIVHGKIGFHVGPTVYRSLWVVDGAFLLESAAILGRGQDARSGIEYMLSKQKPDGGFEILSKYWKENGIVFWAATRHAFLTQDKEWLRSQWPALRRVIKNTQDLRASVSKDPTALDYRLMPPGFIDGGLVGKGKPEYSNTQWNLAGLKAAISAARWLGETEDAAAWQKEYDDFYATFRKAAARDMRKDKFGNAYLPTMMGNADNATPQKGQWSFCHAIYPGQIFAIEDPLAQGQMAMLRATKVEGMVFDTGWMKDGIWNYFASFYGHAALWMGHGDEAAQVLYDFANHSVPTRVWREEQPPLGKGGDEVGDMPHNWASAEFVRLAVHLLEIDRGDELHLLEGMPAEWLKPGMATRLNGVATPFGPLHLAVLVAADGKTATLEIKPLAANCKAVVVHLPDGTKREISPLQGGSLTFPINGK
jgi:hypothetical protein